MWFSVNAIDSSVSSRLLGFNSHSHTVIQCQPISANLRCSSLSRSLFLRIFATQNSRFVFGILQHSELSMTSSFLHLTSDITLCPCQKHPFTKIHVLSSAPQPTAHNHLRLRVLRPNRRHIRVSLLRRELIHNNTSYIKPLASDISPILLSSNTRS